ncbi:hypothetical protein SAM19_05315 [Brevibacillus laterosporus]|nr:hypothetical protein [Brevibacillus laterosporus]
MLLTIFYVGSAGKILGWLGTGKDIQSEYKEEILRYRIIISLTKIYLYIIFVFSIVSLGNENMDFFNVAKYGIIPIALCYYMVGLKKFKLYIIYALIGLISFILNLTFWFYFIMIITLIINYDESIFQRLFGNLIRLMEHFPYIFNHIFYPILVSIVIAIPLLHVIILHSTTVTLNGPENPDSSVITIKIDGQYIPEITKISINDKEINKEDIKLVYSKSSLNIGPDIAAVFTRLFYQGDKYNYMALVNIKEPYKQKGLNNVKVEYIIPSFSKVNATITHEFLQN